MRRISILALGTLGSVRPLAALGRKLMHEGYRVSLAAPTNFRDLAEGMGLEFRRCGADFSEFMRDGSVEGLAGAKPLRQALSWRFPGERARAMFDGALKDAVNATHDADAIVFHPFVSIATDIAEARKIPAILVPLAFMAPSAEAPLSVLPHPHRPLWNKHGYGLLRLQRNAFDRTINDLRTSVLGLPKAFRYKHPHEIHGIRVPAIYPVSPALHPIDHGAASRVHFTGYWHADDETSWQPTGPLAAFLSDGPPAIYTGFGSMTGLSPARIGMLLDACEEIGQRAVLGEGWSSFATALHGRDPARFHVVSYAPHDQLFKHVAAVVHHGGLGTLSTGLRAGRPTLVSPFMLDQTFWGHRVAQLKVGPEPLPITRWSRRRLAATLADLVANPVYRNAAERIGLVMSRENGLATAAEVVRSIIGAPALTTAPEPAA